jgi:hypothetical protein
LDTATGVAFVSTATPTGESHWATALLEMGLYIDNDGLTYVGRSGVVFSDRSHLLRRHTLAKVTIQASSSSYSALKIDAAIFEMPHTCGHIWINCGSFWDALALKMAPGSGAAWYQARCTRWREQACRLGLTEIALRSSLPYNTSNLVGESVDARVLTFTSVHISLLLVISMRSAFSTERVQGRVDKPEARAAFARFVDGLLSYVGDDLSFSLRWDIAVHRCGHLPTGKHPFRIDISNGSMDMSDFLDMHAGGGLMTTKDASSAASKLLGLAGGSFKEFFCGLAASTASHKQGLLLSVFKQVLWQVNYVIEKKLTSPVFTRTVRAVKRELSRAYSDVPAATVQATPCWDPSNWRHVERELGRHQAACQKIYANEQVLSICGPDGTKVGTDLSITMAAFLGPTSKLVGLSFPQVLCVLTCDAVEIEHGCCRFFILEMVTDRTNKQLIQYTYSLKCQSVILGCEL